MISVIIYELGAIDLQRTLVFFSTAYCSWSAYSILFYSILFADAPVWAIPVGQICWWTWWILSVLIISGRYNPEESCVFLWEPYFPNKESLWVRFAVRKVPGWGVVHWVTCTLRVNLFPKVIHTVLFRKVPLNCFCSRNRPGILVHGFHHAAYHKQKSATPQTSGFKPTKGQICQFRGNARCMCCHYRLCVWWYELTSASFFFGIPENNCKYKHYSVFYCGALKYLKMNDRSWQYFFGHEPMYTESSPTWKFWSSCF